MVHSVCAGSKVLGRLFLNTAKTEIASFLIMGVLGRHRGMGVVVVVVAVVG